MTAPVNDARPPRLFVHAAGLWRPGRVRRILCLAGLEPRLPFFARPAPGDLLPTWSEKFGAQG